MSVQNYPRQSRLCIHSRVAQRFVIDTPEAPNHPTWFQVPRKTQPGSEIREISGVGAKLPGAAWSAAHEDHGARKTPRRWVRSGRAKGRHIAMKLVPANGYFIAKT